MTAALGRRAGRIAGRVLLALVAALALAVGGSVALLRTEWGSERARRLALPLVNARMAGDLGVGRFRFGGDRVVLEDVVLRDPEGSPAARVRRIEARFSPLALLRRRVDVRELALERPELALRQDARGLNLARALAARAGAGAGPGAGDDGRSGGPGFVVLLRSLHVRGGVIDFRDARRDAPESVPGARGAGEARAGGAGGPRQVRIEELEAAGAARLDGGARSLRAKLDLRGEVRAPLAAPLVLAAEGELGGERAGGTLDLALGASRAELVVRASGRREPLLSVEVEHLVVDPGLVRAVAPASPLRAPVEVAGRGRWNAAGRTGDVDLTITAAGARVTVQGAVDAARPGTPGLAVRGRGIDLSRLLAGAPASDLAFDLQAHGALGAPGQRGFDPAALRGQLTFTMPPGTLGGRRFGPVRFGVDAHRGRYQVLDLDAALPGVRLTGGGTATGEALDLRAVVALDNLAETVRSLTGGRGPRASGRGRLVLALGGTMARPTLGAEGHLVDLAWQDARVAELAVRARVPDLRSPQAADVELRAPLVRLGAREMRGLALAVRGAGRRLDVAAALDGPVRLRLDAGGVWGRRHRQIDLDRLALEHPGTRWTLARRARVAWPGAALIVQDLELRAGAQALRLDLWRSGPRLRVDAGVVALDLGALSRALLPRRLHVEGRLDAEVHATERRAAGSIDAAALGARLAGRFDVPLAWPPPPSSPLDVDLDLENLDLARLLALAAPESARVRGLRGMASLKVDVASPGAGKALAATVAADVAGLGAGGARVGDVSLRIEGVDGRPLSARLDVRPAATGGGAAAASAVAGSGTITLEAPLSVGTVVRRPPTAEALLGTPVEIRASLQAIPLGAWAKLAGRPEPVGGTATLALSLDGPPRAPAGHLALAVRGLSAPRLPATDGDVDLEIEPRAARATARVSRRGRVLLDARTELEAQVARLFAAGPDALAALADARVRLHAVVGPLALQRLGLPESDRHPPRVLRGLARAEVDLEGTLRAPRVTADVALRDVHLDRTPVGAGQARVAYRDRRLTAEVDVHSPARGTLRVEATAGVDLGYPGVKRLAPRGIPIQARVIARGFDLAGLSGVTPQLRTIGGKLVADATVTGTVGDPEVRGRLEWKEGVLALAGFGEYRRIHLLLHGSEAGAVLEDLSAEGGGGRARVSGRGVHQPGRGYEVSANAALEDFPIHSEGQALATVSLDAVARGRLSSEKVALSVTVDEARVALAELKRKKLQPLARPEDVVLMEGGRPLNRVQERRLAALRAGREAPGRDAAAGKAGAGAAGPAAAMPARPEAPPVVRVTAEAPRNLWVKGKDVNLELGLDPGFRVEQADETRVFGRVVVKRGRVQVVGRRFEIKAGSALRFTGPADAPDLDVTAEYQNDREQVKVVVTVKGTPDRLQLSVKAPDRPELSETDLYTLIVTGRLQLGGGRGTTGSTSPTEKAVSMLGGALATRLGRALSTRLPFDVLAVDTAGNGFWGARLEAGTYLTDNLYVAYVGRLGADPARLQNRNAVHLEFQISRRWSFTGEYGDAKTGSADLMWTKYY